MADHHLGVREHGVRSPNGEDGALAAIFAVIGETNRNFVEIGCGDGTECNTVHLLGNGWRGYWIDRDHAVQHARIHGLQAMVT